MENPIKKYSEQELIDDINDSLTDYKKWIDKEIPISIDWEEELEYMKFTRDWIEDLKDESSVRKLAFDDQKLKNLDASWKKWISENNPSVETENTYWWRNITKLAE